jgi:hypothetical protein
MQEIKVAEDSVDCSPSHHVIIARKIPCDSTSAGIISSKQEGRA